MTKNTKESSILKELMKPQTCVLDNLNTIIGIDSKFKELETNVKGLIDIGNKRNIQYIEQREKFEEELINQLTEQREIYRKNTLDEINDKVDKILRDGNKRVIDRANELLEEKDKNILDQINKKFNDIIEINEKNQLITYENTKTNVFNILAESNKCFLVKVNENIKKNVKANNEYLLGRINELEQRFEEYDTTMSTRVSELEQRLARLESENASP